MALAEGAYHVTPGSDQAHILLSDLEDLTIWMDAVNLTMTKTGLTAFNIYRCANLVTYGPTVWWDTPGFSQATITEVSRTSDKDFLLQYHLDNGYDPSFLVNETTGQLNAEYTNPETGRLEAGPGWSVISGTPAPVDGKENTYNVPLSNSYFIPMVGYKLLARGDFIFCNEVSESNNTIINDFTLLNCAGFGWFSGSNRKTTFDSFSLKPASFPPPNGTELPARSSSADGIHSAGDYIGPTFDSCFFSALDDDCMAVHGSLYSIQGAGASPNSFMAPEGDATVGDVLRFYSNGDFNILGTATVTDAQTDSAPITVSVDHLSQEIQSVISDVSWTNQMRVGSGFSVVNVSAQRLDPMAEQADNVIDSYGTAPNSLSYGSSADDLKTGNRGRGAIIKASNGVIASNVFEGGMCVSSSPFEKALITRALHDLYNFSNVWRARSRT